MNEETSDGRVAWETQRSNLLKSLDKLANQIISNLENPEDADFWKDDFDLGMIASRIHFSWTTFRDNDGYHKLNNYDGVRDAGRKTCDFNPYKYLRGRNLSPNNENYMEEVGRQVDN